MARKDNRGPRRPREEEEEYIPSDSSSSSGEEEDTKRKNKGKKDDDRRRDRNNDKRDRDGHRVNQKNNEPKQKRRKKDEKEGSFEEQAFILLAPFPPPFDEECQREQPNASTKPKRKTPRDRLQEKIDAANFPPKVKEQAEARLNDISSDGQKAISWIEALCKIPFNTFDPMPISTESPQEEIYSFFDKVQHSLDEAVYGMEKVKEEVINYVAQAISTSGKSIPRVLALAGPAGVGKTSIIRRGFAEALHRKMKCVSMGGIRDSSHFVGFDYTYQGSRHGIIAQALMDTGVNNPILFFDELDKISSTPDGIEVQNLLVHLTDPVQNHAFQDKYFAGIDIDLSQALLFFSYNDESLIHPILKDRIHTIHVPSPTLKEKVVIAQKYLLKEVCTNLHMKMEDILLPEDTIKHIVQRYCGEQPGVRTLKRHIETIVMKINTARFLGKKQRYKCFKGENALQFPITITEAMSDECIAEEKKEDKYKLTMYL